jgi:hypothetical protein
MSFMDYLRSPKGMKASLAVYVVSELFVFGAIRHRHNDLAVLDSNPAIRNRYGVIEVVSKDPDNIGDDIDSDFLNVAVPAAAFSFAGAVGLTIGSIKKKRVPDSD